MTLEYIVFFGLILITAVFYIKYELSPKPTLPVDLESLKVESPIERKVFDALRMRGEYVRTQVPCGKYRIDIALPLYNLAIECDGYKYHSSEKAKVHDRKKNAYLRANGWKVLRFPGKQIYRDLPGVLKRIEKAK